MVTDPEKALDPHGPQIGARIFGEKCRSYVLRQAIAQATRLDPRFSLGDLLDYIGKEHKTKDPEQREKLLHEARYFAASVALEITSIDPDNRGHVSPQTCLDFLDISIILEA